MLQTFSMSDAQSELQALLGGTRHLYMHQRRVFVPLPTTTAYPFQESTNICYH
jgi:hypothetical protein